MIAIRIILVVFFHLPLAGIGYSQNNAELVKKIRKEYQRINTISLSKFTLDGEEYLENIPDGGAGLTGYYKKDSLLKIREWIGLSYGNQTREYYFKNGQLFFVFELFESFLETEDGLDKSKTRNSFEGRYCFKEGQLFEKLVKGSNPMVDDQNDVAVELLHQADINARSLRAKKRGK
jgi:hypothetical protein